MSEAAGSADARKRPFDSDPSDLSSNQPKKKVKTKKLSSIARRALLALESDDDGNSSNDGRDVRGFQKQTAGEPAGQPAIRLDGNVALTDKRTKTARETSDDVGGPKEPIATDNDEGEIKSRGHRSPSKSQYEEKIGSRLSEDADTRDGVEITDVSAKLLTGAAKEIVSQPHDNKDKTYDNEVGLITESDGAVATDEDVVRPHAPPSEYNDILSFFLSTPFDDKAMMALHKSKEGSGRAKKKAVSRKDLSQMPILPQKEFIKGAKEKNSAQRGKSLQHAITCGANPISFDAISAEVTSFLISEGKSMISNQPRRPFQYPPAPQPPTQLSPNQQMQPTNNYGFTQQQNPYYPNPILNSYGPLPQIHRGSPHTNNWQPSRYATAPASVFPSAPGAANANNNLPSASTGTRRPVRGAAPTHHSTAAFQTQATAPRPNPKVATSNLETKLTKSIATGVAKLPVSFGFSLDDGGASKILARTAMHKWATDGSAAGKEENQKQGAPEGGLGLKPNNKAFESPDESQRIRRRNAAQSAEPAGPDFPDGWTAKTFERGTPNQGRTGTYKIYYSPVTKTKFRSMKSARIFLDILSEPGINGDENKAFEAFKTRESKKRGFKPMIRKDV